MKIKNLFLVLFAIFFLFGCVESQNFVILENRVAAIEMENNRQKEHKNATSKELAAQNQQAQFTLKKDIEAVKKTLDESRGISQEEYAEFKYDIKTIKEDIQRLDGRIEEIKHLFEAGSQTDKESIEQQLDRIDNAVSRNYERVITLEKYMGFEPSAAGKTENKSKSSGDLKKNTPQELYAFAKKLFDDGDKENARIQFENFINKYPDSDNADNARFWIADSYYSEKWFEKAILEYQKVLEEYPGGNKSAAARLKQGYAFAELGEKANARLILKELLKKHPKSKEAGYAREKLKSLK